MLSTQALALGGWFSSAWDSSALLSALGLLFLVLDFRKKQFETFAFFGVMCCVAAGLQVGHSLAANSYVSNASYNTPIDAPAVAALPVPEIVSAPITSSAILYAARLQLGFDGASARADEGIDLTGTGVRLYVSCYHDISVHLSSGYPMSEKLSVTIEAPALQPSTRLAEDTENLLEGGQFDRKFKMDTRCDLMDGTSIVVQGLKFDPNIATPHSGGKVVVSLNKR